MFFSSYGSLIHGLLEKFYKNEITADQALTSYLVNFKVAVPKNAPSPIVFKNYFNDGYNYLQSLKPFQGEVLAVEEKVETEVGGVSFVGFIDLVGRQNGNLVIIDHKSRALKPRSNRKTPTKSDKLLDDYLVQLYLYSAFVKEKYGEYPGQLCFNCYRSSTVVRESFSQDSFSKAIDWLTSKIEEVAQEQDFSPDLDWFKCVFLCDAHEKCEYFNLMNWRRQ